MTSYLGVIRTVMLADTSQFNLAMAGATRTTRASAMAMRASAQSLVGIGAALNLGITIPTLLAVRAISKVGIEFDSNMMKIKNVTDMTTATFEDFKKAQRDLSFSMGVSQIELSKVGYLAGQAQLKTVAQLTSFQKAVAMSQIVYPSDAKPEEVASGFISVINAFSIKEKDYEKTMAEMIQTINLGTISWQEYSNTIQQVVALSSSFKSPTALKNLNIAAAIGTQGGVRGNQVMTALRNVYTRIYKESGREGSGLNYVAGTKGYRNAAEMFKAHDYNLVSYLKDATGKGLLATPEFLQAIKLGSREITTGGKLANSDPEVEKRFRRQYDRAQADMLEKYEEAINNPINIFKRLGSAYTNLKLEFWSTLGPSIIKVTLGLTELLKTLARLPESAKKLLILIPVLASVASMLTLLIGIFKSAVLSLRMLPSAIGTGNSLVNKTGVAGTGVAGAAAGAAAARNAARATTDAIKEQILRTKLAREIALTEAVLARNVANAAKRAKDTVKTAATAATTTAKAAKATVNAAKMATAANVAAGMTVAELINAAKDAIKNASQGSTRFDIMRRGSHVPATQTSTALVARGTAALAPLFFASKDGMRRIRQKLLGVTTALGPALRRMQQQNLLGMTTALAPVFFPAGKGGMRRIRQKLLGMGGANLLGMTQAIEKRTGNWTRPGYPGPHSQYYVPNFTMPNYGKGKPNFTMPGYVPPFGKGRPNFTHRPNEDYPLATRGGYGVSTTTRNRRNPTFAPYVGGGSMFSGTVPKFFESIKTQFIALLPIIGKWSVVGAKFLGIGLLIFAFFKGLADALSVTLFPVLRSMGFKIENMSDIFGYLVTAVELLSKTFAVLLVTVISLTETVIAKLFALGQITMNMGENFSNIYQPSKRKESLPTTGSFWGDIKQEFEAFTGWSAAFKNFSPERNNQQLLEDLLKLWDAPDGKLKNMFDQKAIDQKVTAETTATNNLLARAPNTKFADFAEYGTQAGFNAIQEGRAGAAEEIRKLREQAAQQQIETIKANAANTNVLAGKLDVLATQ